MLKLSWIFNLLLLTCLSCFSQDTSKIYLHLDRGAYFPGDTVRYKVYLLTNTTLEKRIKNLYIDWFAEDGKVYENSVHLLDNGMTSGQFIIPQSYKKLWINSSIFTNINSREQDSHYIKHIPILYDNIKAEQHDKNPNIGNQPLQLTDYSLFVLKPKIIIEKRNISEKRLNKFRIEGLNEDSHLTVSVTDSFFPATQADIRNDNRSNLIIPTYFQDSLLTVSGRLYSVDEPWSKFIEKYRKATKKSKNKIFNSLIFSFGYKKFEDSKFVYSPISFDTLGFFHIKSLSFVDTLEFRATPVYSSLTYDRFDIDYNFFPFPKRTHVQTIPPKYPFYNREWLYDPWYILDTNKRQIGLREITIFSQKRDGRLKELDAIYPKDWFRKNRSVLDIDVFKEHEYFPEVTNIESLIYKVAKREGINLRRSGYIGLYNNWHMQMGGGWSRPMAGEPMNQIKYIKVYDNYPFNPIPNGQGAFMYYTTGPDGRNVDIGRVVKYKKVGGYKAEIPYGKRTYKTADEVMLSTYDDRISLFWDAQVNLNANQPYYFEFYNNSRQGSYIITVQGITASGKPVFIQQQF